MPDFQIPEVFFAKQAMHAEVELMALKTQLAELKERLLTTESVLATLVNTAGGPLCTGLGTHVISPTFLEAWKRAFDFLAARKPC